MHTKKLALGLILVAACALQPAYAYIDPGAGSALLQGLLAAAAAGMIFFRRILDVIQNVWFSFRNRNKRDTKA